MSKEHVMVLEISNVSQEQIQIDLGKAFQEFSAKHKDAVITARILSSKGSKIVKSVLDVEGR